MDRQKDNDNSRSACNGGAGSGSDFHPSIPGDRFAGAAVGDVLGKPLASGGHIVRAGSFWRRGHQADGGLRGISWMEVQPACAGNRDCSWRGVWNPGACSEESPENISDCIWPVFVHRDGHGNVLWGTDIVNPVLNGGDIAHTSLHSAGLETAFIKLFCFYCK